MELREPGLGAGVFLQDPLAGVERGGHYSRPSKGQGGRFTSVERRGTGDGGWDGGFKNFCLERREAGLQRIEASRGRGWGSIGFV